MLFLVSLVLQVFQFLNASTDASLDLSSLSESPIKHAKTLLKSPKIHETLQQTAKTAKDKVLPLLIALNLVASPSDLIKHVPANVSEYIGDCVDYDHFKYAKAVKKGIPMASKKEMFGNASSAYILYYIRVKRAAFQLAQNKMITTSEFASNFWLPEEASIYAQKPFASLISDVNWHLRDVSMRGQLIKKVHVARTVSPANFFLALSEMDFDDGKFLQEVLKDVVVREGELVGWMSLLAMSQENSQKIASYINQDHDEKQKETIKSLSEYDWTSNNTLGGDGFEETKEILIEARLKVLSYLTGKLILEKDVVKLDFPPKTNTVCSKTMEEIMLAFVLLLKHYQTRFSDPFNGNEQEIPIKNTQDYCPLAYLNPFGMFLRKMLKKTAFYLFGDVCRLTSPP